MASRSISPSVSRKEASKNATEAVAAKAADVDELLKSAEDRVKDAEERAKRAEKGRKKAEKGRKKEKKKAERAKRKAGRAKRKAEREKSRAEEAEWRLGEEKKKNEAMAAMAALSILAAKTETDIADKLTSEMKERLACLLARDIPNIPLAHVYTLQCPVRKCKYKGNRRIQLGVASFQLSNVTYYCHPECEGDFNLLLFFSIFI